MPDFEKISGVSATSIEKVNGLSLSSVESVLGLSTPATSTFLEDYPGAVAAYSLRKLSSTATSAIRVRNNSGAEADIGFDSNGDLDTASLLLHCGSNDGRVTTWYDQSGNSNHMTQSTQADMPYIVDSGSTIVTSRESIPAIDFYFGSDGKHLSDTFSSNNGDHFILSYVAEFESVTDAQQIVSQWTSSQSTQTLQTSILGGTSSLRIAARYSDSSNSLGRADTASSVTVSTGTEYVVVGYISATPYEGDIDLNGDTATTTTGFPSSGSLRTASAGITIGRRHDNGAAQYRGYLSEMIIWSASTLPNRNSIMTDTKSHYGIT